MICPGFQSLRVLFQKDAVIGNACFLGNILGGETGSLVMEIAPELYTAFLHCSSKWDGDLEPLTEAMTPVYLATGIEDSYYGSSSVRETYEKLREMYEEKGLSEKQIEQLVVLDLKYQDWFDERNISDQHAAGAYFAHEEGIMSWLFGDHDLNAQGD